jgi:hypothetical protein
VTPKRPIQGWREPVILKLLDDRATMLRADKEADVSRIDSALRELVLPK